MSKRLSSGQTNTLLNYFQSPKIKKQEPKNGNDLNDSKPNLKPESLNKSSVQDGW